MHLHIQIIADSLFDAIDVNVEVTEGDELDLTNRYIVQLPLMSIAAMLGIPLADYQSLHIWTQDMLSANQETIAHAICIFRST